VVVAVRHGIPAQPQGSKSKAPSVFISGLGVSQLFVSPVLDLSKPKPRVGVRIDVEPTTTSAAAVVNSAVVGRSVGGDEEVVAFVQLLPESPVTVIELADYAAQHLASYKRPSEIIPVSAMPLTPTGKIVKSELLKILANAAPVS